MFHARAETLEGDLHFTQRVGPLSALHSGPAMINHGQPTHMARPSSAGRILRLFAWAVPLIMMAMTFIYWDVVCQTWGLATLNLRWRSHAADFVLSAAHDDFDVTFANYSVDQQHAGGQYEDRVPAVLHHIALGTKRSDWRPEWEEALRSCTELHPGWETRLWTDDDVLPFVESKFPDFKKTWDAYPYPIERVDALRYMILYELGGAILDLDLRCRRALGPLRRFGFVAPEAHPTGFSISFVMSERHNPFVGEIIRNLPWYNRRWFGLPYAAVMFSTGGHFASVLHTLQKDRSVAKVLPGPLHSLNGRVTTPLFEHLGSSSWHSYDAQLFTMVGNAHHVLPICIGVSVALVIFWRRRAIFRRLRLS